MKINVKLILCFLFIQHTIYANNIKVNHTIDLPGFNFYVDSVIVVQEEQVVIGHNIEYRKLSPLKLKEKRIDLALQNIFRKSFPLNDDSRHLIIKVNRIVFNTFDRNSEFASHITFIENRNGELLELVTLRSSWTNENTLDIFFQASSRGYDLVKCLARVCRDFLASESLKNEFLSVGKEELYQPIEINAENFPIIKNPDRFLKGVVLSFEDFIRGNLRADESLQFKEVELKKSQFNKIKLEKSAYHQDSIFAIYDGKNYYLNDGTHFRPVIFHNDKLYVHAPAKSDGFVDELPFLFALGSSAVVNANLDSDTSFGRRLLISTGVSLGVGLITLGIVNSTKKYVYYEIDLHTGLLNQIKDKKLN
jgi:hypothetical protein